jgi:hypothetical protein
VNPSCHFLLLFLAKEEVQYDGMLSPAAECVVSMVCCVRIGQDYVPKSDMLV